MKKIIPIFTILIFFSCSKNESLITNLTSEELQIDSILYCPFGDCDFYSVCQYDENGNISAIHQSEKDGEHTVIFTFQYYSDSLVIEQFSDDCSNIYSEVFLLNEKGYIIYGKLNMRTYEYNNDYLIREYSYWDTIIYSIANNNVISKKHIYIDMNDNLKTHTYKYEYGEDINYIDWDLVLGGEPERIFLGKNNKNLILREGTELEERHYYLFDERNRVIKRTSECDGNVCSVDIIIKYKN
jgi:hypothetical protein